MGRMGRNGSDRRQVVRLVQRGKRHQLIEICKHRVVYPDRRGILKAAVNDTMTDRGNLVAAYQPNNDLHQLPCCDLMRDASLLPDALRNNLAGTVPNLK